MSRAAKACACDARAGDGERKGSMMEGERLDAGTWVTA
jgi:hypothetical protein